MAPQVPTWVKILVPLPDAEAILGILRHGLHNDITETELRILSHQAVGQSAAEIDAAIRAARSDARHARKPLDLSQLQARMGVNASRGPMTVSCGGLPCMPSQVPHLDSAQS